MGFLPDLGHERTLNNLNCPVSCPWAAASDMPLAPLSGLPGVG